jgi:transposase
MVSYTCGMDPKIGIIKRLGHLPILMDFLRRSQLFEIIDKAICDDRRSKVSTSECVAVLLCSVFSGAHDLWRVREHLSLYDMKTVMRDPEFNLDEFPEERLAKALDDLYAANLDKLMTAISIQVIEQFNLNTEFLGFDTTSLSVYGAYEEDEDLAVMPDQPAKRKPGPLITYGHAKNNRGDLKQFLFGSLVTAADGGVPLRGAALDGNQGDSVSAAQFFSYVRDIVADPRTVCCVADSKGWCARVLKVIMKDGMRLLSRLPRTNGLHDQLMQTKWQPTQTYEMPSKRRNSEPDVYTCMAFDLDEQFTLVTPSDDPTVKPTKESFSVPVRALRVHSTALQRTKVKSLQRLKKRELAGAAKALKTWSTYGYATAREAKHAGEKLCSEHGWVTLSLEATPKRCKGPMRRGRGRPTKNSGVQLEGGHYRLNLTTSPVRQSVLVHRLHEQSSFILIRTRNAGWEIDDQELIPRYKGQYHNEHGFAWLKSGAGLNPIFLHTPLRIGSLSFIYFLGLMAWNLIQREVRSNLVKTNSELPYHRGKPSKRITTRFLFYLFNEVYMVTCQLQDGSWRKLLSGLNETQIKACKALNSNAEIYDPNIDQAKAINYSRQKT